MIKNCSLEQINFILDFSRRIKIDFGNIEEYVCNLSPFFSQQVAVKI